MGRRPDSVTAATTFGGLLDRKFIDTILLLHRAQLYLLLQSFPIVVCLIGSTIKLKNIELAGRKATTGGGCAGPRYSCIGPAAGSSDGFYRHAGWVAAPGRISARPEAACRKAVVPGGRLFERGRCDRLREVEALSEAAVPIKETAPGEIYRC